MGEPGMGEPGMGEPGMGEPGMGEPGMGKSCKGMGEPGMGKSCKGMGESRKGGFRRIKKTYRNKKYNFKKRIKGYKTRKGKLSKCRHFMRGGNYVVPFNSSS
jgi:hypothetical protein